jgi:hypothetical protein
MLATLSTDAGWVGALLGDIGCGILEVLGSVVA